MTMHTGKSYNYRIADFNIVITFSKDGINDCNLIPSFRVFERPVPQEDLMFSLDVDDTFHPIPKERRERIRDFDTGNGTTIVDRIDDGGYQFIIKDIMGRSCCLLQANKEFDQCRCALNGDYNMRSFGLNNALMLIFAFNGCRRQTLLIHASLVRHNGRGYAFIAKSGTGKSTQVSMWLRHIPDCDLMNDDNPIIRVIDGKPFIYGSPWSGKTPCYRDVKAPLGAITRISRAKTNSVEKLKPVEAFASLLPSCSSMKWDETIFGCICDTVTSIIGTTGIYTLHCLPNREAAEVCAAAIVPNDSKKTYTKPGSVGRGNDGLAALCADSDAHTPEHTSNKPEIKEIKFKNAQFMPEVVNLLDEGHTVTLKLKGFSMRPFLEDGRDKALLIKATTIRKGDAVLAEISKGVYVLHRIVKIKGENVTLRGDGNLGVEHCKKSDVKGFAIGFYRKGRTAIDKTNQPKWLVYSFLWCALLPFRRYLLAFYRRVWIRMRAH